MTKRRKAKGRSGVGGFVAMPHVLLRHENFATLSPKATKLFMDIAARYTGSNNGDFATAWKVMKGRGWASRDTLFRAQQELEERGFLVKTRQGGRNRCNLYALTLWPIDDCKGKLDVPPTRVASAEWKAFSVTRISGELNPNTVLVSPEQQDRSTPLTRISCKSGLKLVTG